MRRRWLLLTIVLVWVTAHAGERAPLPAKLKSAKTAFLVNDGVWYKVHDKFYAELKKWGRFQIVESKEEADIVIVLSTRAGELGGAVAVPSGQVVVGGSESKFFLRISDAKDGTPLWSDSTGEAMLVSNSAKRFVKTLKQRMEGN
jgi:hypothetical protein